MKKIAFICLKGLETFIKPMQEIDKLPDVESRLYLVSDTTEMGKAIEWADVVWLEWANELAIYASKDVNIYDKEKVICRLHSYEALSDFPAKIDWRAIDELVFVAPHIKDILYEQWPNIQRTVEDRVIYNGVNPVEPIGKPGYNIAVVGGISHKKAPELALQVLSALWPYSDGEKYQMYFAGDFQEKRYEIYMKHMVQEMGFEDKVHFLGHVENMDEFWQDKNFLLNTSVHEGHNVSILEAMSRGIMPIIHNFYGADQTYIGCDWDVLFNDVDDAAEIMYGINKGEKYPSTQTYLLDRGWTLDNQIKQVREVLDV